MSALPLIMVIEHDTVLHLAYVRALSREGRLILGAYDVTEGLAMLEQFERAPDIILLDMLLPERNGLAFLEEFKPLLHPETSVIVFTTTLNPAEAEAAYALGASRCIFRAYVTLANLRHMTVALIEEKKLIE